MTDADHDRETLERGRYLAASTDLSSREGLALAYREQGYSHGAIAREIVSTEGTVRSYMRRIAAQYGLSAIETKPEDERTDFEEVTTERLMALSDDVLDQYKEIARHAPEHVPASVHEEVLSE